MWVGCAKTAEWINILFGVETPGDPRWGCPPLHGKGEGV